MIDEAAKAVKAEWRRCSELIELRAREVQPTEADERVFRIDVGRNAEFDWTWEGARAFRTTAGDPLPQEPEDLTEPGQWSGEVVETDPDAGLIYVTCDPPSSPSAGTFHVRPFGFLEALNDIYNGEARQLLETRLVSRLDLSRGAGRPGRCRVTSQGLEQLRSIWGFDWEILWGPPGTGKTYTIGEQVASLLTSPGGRILVLSTTNKATDGVAISIGKAIRRREGDLTKVARLGSGANIKSFEAENLEVMLKDANEGLRRQLAELLHDYRRSRDQDVRASLYRRIQEVRKAIVSSSPFLSSTPRVIVCTAFHAVQRLASREVAELAGSGAPPFETVIVDEASLISRAAATALAALGSQRLLLVGDPRQLSPISKMSRLLPTHEGTWLGSSGLTHLRPGDQLPDGALMLTVQRRMCPEIRKVVSEYQYGGRLEDAPEIPNRPFSHDKALVTAPRAIWYVLDEESGPVAHTIRAERGPSGRSWMRQATLDVLRRLRDSHPNLAAGEVLFLSPFTAQVRLAAGFLAEQGATSWHAASVHSQQGAEADYVVFDTVQASSTGWSHDEWVRLINVAMSRARHQLIVLASRDEMGQPYLAPLRNLLTPMRLHRGAWQACARDFEYVPPVQPGDGTLGAQIRARRSLRPILSSEQQRLCNLPLDGKHRLVRGVAGSGKTVVLAHWVVQTLSRADFQGRVWIVYGNKAMHHLLHKLIDETWKEKFPLLPDAPWEQIELKHIKDLLSELLLQVNLRAGGDFDYEGWSRSYMAQAGEIAPRCQAMFIDEAQDMGHDTLRLLTLLVEARGADSSGRGVMLFYDNAQNVYGRTPPVGLSWASTCAAAPR